MVPAFNEERGLAASLASISTAMAAFAPLGWTSELIVCDNNSTDATADIARAAGATVVFEPINQIARARNRGAAAATGDWLIFVDADSHPSRELLADVAEEIEARRCLAGGSTIAYDGHVARGARLGAAIWNLLSRINRWAAGSFIFCEAAAFREMGGFNEALYAAEELDLFQRLKRVARRQRRTIVILRKHPLQTSARKMHLYSQRELATFMWRTLVRRGRNLRDPAECYAWYDGRR